MGGDAFDVVIVGGGVMGSATAYFLAKEPAFKGRIAVIERDSSYQFATTARSAGGLRQQFSVEENIALSLFGLSLVRALKEEFGSEADVGFREQGYLLLASEEGRDVLAANVAIQRKAQADIHLMQPAELRVRFPWLNCDGIAAGSYGASGEGWLDPVSWMTLMRKGALALGVRYLEGEVTAVEVENDRVCAAVLAGGSRVACGAFVNAAGPSAGDIAAMAGVRLPVLPRKRYVYVLDCRQATEALHKAPLTVDPSGIWVRPEGRMFLTGLSPTVAEDEPPIGNFDVDHAWFEERIWNTLASRVPAFESIKVVNAWACHYDTNTLDENAVIGPHPRISNLYFINGFSGHGLQQAPAAGRAVAELIVHGGFRSINLARFGYGRIERNEPLLESNII
jgi:glycine/D-amino acid oxidase-like deaminating enzyme